MKRTWLILIGIAALIGGMIVVPPLSQLILFKLAVDRYPSAQELGPNNGRGLAEICAGCHGITGNSINSRYPNLAGQPPAYLERQLNLFASGERNSMTMGPLARSLSEDQIQRVSRYFSEQARIAPTLPELERANLQRANLLLNSCRACHGLHFEGGEVGGIAIPRLSGQGALYLEPQMRAFREGTRHSALPTMNPLLRDLPAEDLTLASGYLSRYHAR